MGVGWALCATLRINVVRACGACAPRRRATHAAGASLQCIYGERPPRRAAAAAARHPRRQAGTGLQPGGPHEPMAGDDGDAADIDVFQVVSALIGGVALLSYSMNTMSLALRGAFGASLRDAIKAACGNRFTAFITGTLATAA